MKNKKLTQEEKAKCFRIACTMCLREMDSANAILYTKIFEAVERMGESFDLETAVKIQMETEVLFTHEIDRTIVAIPNDAKKITIYIEDKDGKTTSGMTVSEGVDTFKILGLLRFYEKQMWMKMNSQTDKK